MNSSDQLKTLSSYPASFADEIGAHVNHGGQIDALSLKIFQVNIGKVCNQACTHCHVDASPNRTEAMDLKTVDLCLKVISDIDEIEVVDITGGAPEMNKNFTYFVSECRRLGKHVIDRCNLTILETEGYDYLYDFLSENGVEIVASLPHYSQSFTDRQRGRGVFDTSITALTKLNQKGYGNGRILNLVYNPVGIFLSSSQRQLEREFKENLKRKHGLQFNNLLCINNLPINRFLTSLLRAGKFNTYMETLVNAFNPSTIKGLMCRHQISVGYDGSVYDCDFNQMLEIHSRPVTHINDFDYQRFISRNIQVANHCFGCTAGAGSSCGGEIISDCQ